MTNPVLIALALLALLQVKHVLADFFLQTRRMLEDRGRYLHFGRLQHAGLHSVGTLVVLVLMGVPVNLAITISLVEWIVHFHIDWAKGCWSERTGEGPEQAGFWRAFGVDQGAHQWTYLVIVWFALA